MNKKERNLYDYSGLSTKHGVTFFGLNYIVATYYERGTDKIRHIVYPKTKKGLDKILGFLSKRKITFSDFLKRFFMFILVILASCIEIYLQNIVYEKSTLLFESFYIFIQLVVFFYLLFTLFKFLSKENDETKKYHAAEHMTASAFRKLGYVPSIDVIKTFSRYHPRCGIFKITNLLFILNISYIFHLIFKINVLPLALILLLYIELPIGINPYSFIIQMYFTTKNPEDKHLIIAKACYEKTLCLDKEIGVIYDNEEMSYERFKRIKYLLASVMCQKVPDEMEIQRLADDLIDTENQMELEKEMFFA